MRRISRREVRFQGAEESAPLPRIFSTPPHWIRPDSQDFRINLGPDFGEGDNPSRDV